MNTYNIYKIIVGSLPDELSSKFKAGTSAQMRRIFKQLQKIDFNGMLYVFHLFVKGLVVIDKEQYNCNDISKLIKLSRESYLENEHNYRFWTGDRLVEFYRRYIESRYDLSNITAKDISDEQKLIEFLIKNENFAIIETNDNTYVFKLTNNNEKKI